MSVHRHRLSRVATRPSTITTPVQTGPPVTPRALRPLAARLRDRFSSDQGDVPGWVLITLMTAGIVVALWAVASDQIVQIFTNALAPFLDGQL